MASVRISLEVPSYRREGMLLVVIDTYLSYVAPELVANGMRPTLSVSAQGYRKYYIESLAFKYKKQIEEGQLLLFDIPAYERPTSQTQIRSDLHQFVRAMIAEPIAFTVLLDDDMQFKSGSGLAIAESVRYMQEHPGLGLIQMSGYLGGYFDHGGHLLRRWNGHFWTDRGLVIRDIGEDLFLPEDVGRPGGLVETYIFTHYLLKGYSAATKKNVPTLHRSNRNRTKARLEADAELSEEDLKNHMHRRDFIEDALDLFNQRLGAGTYRVKQFEPKLELEYRGPSLTCFEQHLRAAHQKFGYSDYLFEGGTYSRGLPRGWESVLAGLVEVD